MFSAARDSFKAGDYQPALDLTDQVIKDTPNAPVVHEFRALCLFALKRYAEAASVTYAVLSAGPCWNWSTLVGLYPDVETYTSQLRGLEAAVGSDVNATPARFLLAYHYLVQGHNDAAGTQFAAVVKLEPKDQLSASFAKALTKAKESTATAATATPPAVAGALVHRGRAGSAHGRRVRQFRREAPAEAPLPPAELTGAWKAAPSPDTAITLAIQADGGFTWNVANKGQPNESITGRAVYVNDVLSLTQEEGPPLAGKIESKEASKLYSASWAGATTLPRSRSAAEWVTEGRNPGTHELVGRSNRPAHPLTDARGGMRPTESRQKTCIYDHLIDSLNRLPRRAGRAAS